jgi:DNA-binding HxlR family transcriptional regulator
MRSGAAAKRRPHPEAAKLGSLKGRPEFVRERNCSVARTLGILSNAWTFLVIREAFFGAKRFETFRASLGLPKATLTERLKWLTEQGISGRTDIPKPRSAWNTA